MEFPRIYLASKSPRRRHLLEACNLEFELIDAEVDESDYPDSLASADIAEYLACRKAECGLETVRDGIVIAADSLVLCDGQILGKPMDREDAFRMLRLLSDNKHQVVTGVCIHDQQKRIAFSDFSDVTFAPISETEMQYYVDAFKPFDKAGAYAVQEWIGHCKIIRIEGSYTNIMGLPTERLYRALQSWDETV
jgi:septum formation protein